MADIDKAREVAQNIKSGFIIADPHSDARILADAFLALDKLLETHPPSEKPEKYLDVLIVIKEGHFHAGCEVGCWEHDENWSVCDMVCTTADIKHWQRLLTADKK